MTDRSVNPGDAPAAPRERIGKILKQEEERFIDFVEIERKSKDLGFGMSVRTLRFYIDEGILPPPKRVGKTPVYEEDWILNVLLAIHLMKARMNRSLAEVRAVLRLPKDEDAAILADKLSILYEEYVKGGALKPPEREWVVEAFFAVLTGKHGRALGPSEVRLTDLVRAAQELGRFVPGKLGAVEWLAPEPRALVAFLGLDAAAASAPAPPAPPPPPAPVVTKAPASPEKSRQEPLAEAALPSPISLPPGAVAVDRARSLEEQFIARFEAAFAALERIEDPRDGRVLRAGPKDRSHLKRDHSSRVIELMKRNRVYERALLDAIPLDAASEFHVHHRSLFGRGDCRLVVAALSLSPLEDLVVRRHATGPLGPLDIERALSELVVQDDIFYYVGILSTVGWSADARSRGVREGKNLLACLVEPGVGEAGAAPWRRALTPDERWCGLERLFDPESEREKVERVRAWLETSPELAPRGGHVILKNAAEDLDVTPDVLSAAVAELLAKDEDLSLQEVAGREILKRRRI